MTTLAKKVTYALAVAAALLLAPQARAGDVSYEYLSTTAPAASASATASTCCCGSAHVAK
jgi:hypothetical protein